MSSLKNDIKGIGVGCLGQAALLMLAGILAIGWVAYRFIVPAVFYYLISRH